VKIMSALAAAYSRLMASELAERLERNGVPAHEIVVRARFRPSSDAPWSADDLEVNVRARVPGVDEERLRAVASVALACSRRALGRRRDLRTKLRVSLEH
jgi:2-methylaconitate cis-trans-isomerase PrpF